MLKYGADRTVKWKIRLVPDCNAYVRLLAVQNVLCSTLTVSVLYLASRRNYYSKTFHYMEEKQQVKVKSAN